MKKILVAMLVLSMFMLPSTVLAGGLSVGPKLGFNYANVTGDDVKDSDAVIKLAIGGVLVYRFSDLIALQPELLYSMKGAKDALDKTYNVSYLEIPVLVKFSFLTGKVHPIVFVGPALAMLVSADYDGEDIKDYLSDTDIGLVLGAGVEIAELGPGTLAVDLRYEMGLTTIASSDWKNAQGDTADVKNSVISLMVGYLFSL